MLTYIVKDHDRTSFPRQTSGRKDCRSTVELGGPGLVIKVVL